MRRPIFPILAIILIVFLGWLLFFRGGGTKTPAPVSKKAKVLYDYADSDTAEVIHTTQGKLVGNDAYRSIRITVARDFRRIEVLDGYDMVVEKSRDFSNNQIAFDAFLRALERSGYSKDRSNAPADERGFCPTGNRYIYELKDGDEELERTWSTSCTTAQGNFGGQASLIRQLFQAQITGYGQFVAGIQIL
jgi:hypothetical protein